MRKSLLILLCIALPALGQLNRTAVSVHGNDNNTCAVVSPCRSFAAAYQQTSNGGEIIALDSGGYGPLNIYRSIKIIAPPGVYAGVTVTGGGYGFWIAAGAADQVVIRGIAINATGSSTPIYVYSGGSVAIENITADGGGGNCIIHHDGDVSVTDSVLRNCFNGVVSNVPPGARITVSGVTVANNTNGAFAAEGSSAFTIRDSVAIGGNSGFFAGALSGLATMSVENCAATGQRGGGGAVAGGNGILRISNSHLSDNVRGLWVTGGGTLETFGNNEIRGNSTNIDGAPTPVSSN